ncbi:hypothetical protein BDZ91DRAFT_723321 [Kalaharituber pfeilii]|nr:hypothetical protein BDZ91DRAFT_723321 [Kalaharituber pfeilii]
MYRSPSLSQFRFILPASLSCYRSICYVIFHPIVIKPTLFPLLLYSDLVELVLFSTASFSTCIQIPSRYIGY